MGKKSLEKFCNNLFVNLTESFVFYIPDNSFFNSINDQADSEILKEYFQKVVIMDWHKGPLMYASSSVKFNGLEKSSLLSKNILFLIEKKSKLDDQGFKYVLSKYLDQAQALYYMTTCFVEPFRIKEIEPFDDKTIKDLRVQQQVFEKHIIELNKVFRCEETIVVEADSTKTIESQIPVLLDQIGRMESNLLINNDIVERLVNQSKISKHNDLVEIKSKKKELLITEVEVEEFLLKTVFNLSLSFFK